MGVNTYVEGSEYVFDVIAGSPPGTRVALRLTAAGRVAVRAPHLPSPQMHHVFVDASGAEWLGTSGPMGGGQVQALRETAPGGDRVCVLGVRLLTT